MEDEKVDVEKLLGMESSEIDAQVDRLQELVRLSENIGDADPLTLTMVCRQEANTWMDLAEADHTSSTVLCNGVIKLAFLISLLSKRVDHDNPVTQIITDLH